MNHENFVPSEFIMSNYHWTEITKLASRVLALLRIKWLTSVDAQTLELPTFVLFCFVLLLFCLPVQRLKMKTAYRMNFDFSKRADED